jgi:Mrp family chromosome partitioning ATPase
MDELQTSTSQSDDMPSAAIWQDCLLQTEDVAAMSRLETAKTPAMPAANIRVEPTPSEFTHLYAALERQVAGIGDITLLTGESLGAERPYVLGISSAVRGEGKTTVAMHLAMTIARDTYKRVCLIDLSLSGDSIGKRLGLSGNHAGLVPVLEDIDNVIPTLQIAGYENLVIIPAGRAPKNPQKMARSPRVAQMIISTRHTFDVVVVDMPPVSSDNALPLARHMDGVVMVARAGATPSDVVARGIDTIGRDRVVGLVMNRMHSSMPVWLQRYFARA